MASKRTNEEMQQDGHAMLLDDPRTTQDLLETLSMKLKSTKEADRAEACAILSSLDPNSKAIHQRFLVKDFCQDLLFPCLTNTASMATRMEAANTVKCWLGASVEEDREALFVLKRLYALGVVTALVQTMPVLCKALEEYVNLATQADREILEETVESVLAAVMLIGESLAVSWEQHLNSSHLIDLIIAVLDRRQFVKESLLCVAMECLAVATEDNAPFYAGPKGLRLCLMLAALTNGDMPSGKAAPLAIRALVAIAEAHATPQDAVVERAVANLGKLLRSAADPDVLGAAFETLARLFEDVNPEGLEAEDHRQLLELLEVCAQKLTLLLTTSSTGMADEDGNAMALMECVSRGFGAAVNLLVLLAGGAINDNVIGMLAAEALGVWLPSCVTSDSGMEATEVLLRLLRVLASAANSPLPCTAEQYTLVLSAASIHAGGISLAVLLYRPEFVEQSAELVSQLRRTLQQPMDEPSREDLFDALEGATGHHYDDLELCINAFISALEAATI